MSAQTYIAKDGDTVDSIAWAYYGTLDGRVVEQLLEANPALADLGPLLPAGTSVTLPDIQTSAELSGVKLWE